jgi:hypothetical protein
MSFAIEPARIGSKVPPRSRIGDLLVASGALRPLDVQRIVSKQRETSKRFGEIALEMKLVTAEQLSCALAKQIGYPYVEYGQSALSQTLAAAYEPFCDYAEALRTLRSQLLMRWFGREQRALAISSARRDEACSTVAGNLAIVFAQLGENTLLIDANLREPQQHRLLRLGRVQWARGSHQRALRCRGRFAASRSVRAADGHDRRSAAAESPGDLGRVGVRGCARGSRRRVRRRDHRHAAPARLRGRRDRVSACRRLRSERASSSNTDRRPESLEDPVETDGCDGSRGCDQRMKAFSR